ncbi:hypothetical protein BH09ACT12_BH09ACT12_37200 [soil metagenome]
MRLALRRGAAAPDPDPDGHGAAGPVAAFAGILDGRLLWVAVAAQPGRLALRRSDGGEVLSLPTEEITDQPDYLGVRIDLTGLDGPEARYDVVLVPPGSGDPVDVHTAPLAPTATRPSADGHTQHTLVRTPAGTLRVRTTSLPSAAGLLAVRKLADAVELTLLDAGPELAILDDAEQPLASWPVDEHGVVPITRDSVSGLEPMTRPVVTGRPGAWQPVRRRANDLVDPRTAAPLPQIDHPDADRPRLRLPWSREAMLLMRVFPLDEPSS